MKGLVRWVLTALAVLSLVLCAATVTLWVRGYRYEEVWIWGYGTGAGQASITSTKGGLVLGCIDLGPSYGPIEGVVHGQTRPTNPTLFADHSLLGFGYRSRWPPGGYLKDVVVPCWAVVMLTAAWPAAWVWRRAKARGRPGAGRCRHCSYDLTGNVSGVCPECGTEVRT